MTISIIPIQEKESEAVYQMFQDIPAEENRAQNHANGMSRSEFDDFCKLSVSYAQKDNLPEGRVPQTLYIIFDDNVPVGFGKFRPFLNEDCIKRKIGHFAYMTSPKHRGKGYAQALLGFFKQQAQELGLTEIEGGTTKDNIISQHIMEKLGGHLKEILEDKVIYVIPLQN